MKLLLGADPEIFVLKNKEFSSAHKLVPGTKYRPHKVDNGAVQVDGMALEFNITPASNKKEWIHHIDSVMATLKDMVPKEYSFSEQASAMFSKEHMDDQPKIARMLGCDPDFNAYTKEKNPRPNEKTLLRTAAGHIHLGWGRGMKMDKGHLEECYLLAKQLDVYLGAPSVLLDPDDQRRKLYGQAGAFRPKPYGMEYRVLSNFWIMHTHLQEWVYDTAKLAFNRLMQDEDDSKSCWNNAITAINLGDIWSANKVVKQLQISLPDIGYRRAA